MFLNANLLIAGIILIGGVLLLLPQNGVMAWIESGSVDTITDDMASVNMVVSDRIISSVEGINHSVTSSSEQLVIIINNTGDHIQIVLDTIRGFENNLDELLSRE